MQKYLNTSILCLFIPCSEVTTCLSLIQFYFNTLISDRNHLCIIQLRMFDVCLLKSIKTMISLIAFLKGNYGN